jgi:hypothetical protein
MDLAVFDDIVNLSKEGVRNRILLGMGEGVRVSN